MSFILLAKTLDNFFSSFTVLWFVGKNAFEQFDGRIPVFVLRVVRDQVGEQLGSPVAVQNFDDLSFDGEEVTLEDFGGVKKGSEVFIKKDIISLMRFSKE